MVMNQYIIIVSCGFVAKISHIGSWKSFCWSLRLIRKSVEKFLQRDLSPPIVPHLRSPTQTFKLAFFLPCIMVTQDQVNLLDIQILLEEEHPSKAAPYAIGTSILPVDEEDA